MVEKKRRAINDMVTIKCPSCEEGKIVFRTKGADNRTGKARHFTLSDPGLPVGILNDLGGQVFLCPNPRCREKFYILSVAKAQIMKVKAS